MASSSELPISAFPAWAHLNGVDFTNVKLEEVEGKGFGLVYGRNQDPSFQESAHEGTASLLKIPEQLVLSANAVDQYAKVDQNFRQLLDAAGRETTRGDILLYLLVHTVLPRTKLAVKGFTPSPWTEYIKFLPRSLPVPTMWSEDERSLLHGTSLESAVSAKLTALTGEFEDLRERTSPLPFWQSHFWDEETATLDDWVLADAWYRSRCLELPHAGEAMVPGLDMVNHSRTASAYYDEDDGNAVLERRSDSRLAAGQEVTISYGDAKSAAEMLFSYGFIDDEETGRNHLTLPLRPLPDDPLARAKVHAYGAAPTVKLSLSADGVAAWDSPFAHLMCVNEEDGLDFRLLQDVSGETQLKMFWQEKDVTAHADQFEALVKEHPLAQVLSLRTVAVLCDLVTTQLERVMSGPSGEDLRKLVASGLLRQECASAAETLRRIESEVLGGVVKELEQQKSNLLEDEQVLAYLGSMDQPTDGPEPADQAHEEDDFS